MLQHRTGPLRCWLQQGQQRQWRQLVGIAEGNLQRPQTQAVVLVLPLRDPGLLALQARTLAEVAPDRLVLGIGLGAYTGVLLGTLGARPAWSSAVLGPLFLVSGLSTGAALMMLFSLGSRPG